MRALIQENAAALAVPGRLPACCVIIGLGAVPVRDDPVHALHRAKLAALDHFVQLAIHAVGALVEHDREGLIALCSNLVHLADLLRINACGLFTDGMHAMGQRVDHKLRMKIMGRSDEDCVHLT